MHQQKHAQWDIKNENSETISHQPHTSRSETSEASSGLEVLAPIVFSLASCSSCPAVVVGIPTAFPQNDPLWFTQGVEATKKKLSSKL